MSEETDYDVKKLEKLLDRMAESELSDEEIDELQEILLSSEQARAKYINFNYMDDSLHWNYAEAALDNKRENEFFRETVEEVQTKKTISFVWPAAAAALFFAFIFISNMSNNDSSSDLSIAVLIDGQGAEWSAPVSKKLEPGPLSLVSGKAKIIFDSGAEMSLNAPVELDLKSHVHARLIRGKVKLYAPESAIGFRLETEASNFVDIGTEFEVSVDENNNSEIHVLDGVVVARSNYSDAVVPFGQNEAGFIDSLHGKIVPVNKGERLNPILAAEGQTKPILNKESRVIFIGERNTDFETYLHMINQAIYDYDPLNGPTLLNAGLTYKLGSPEKDYEEFVSRKKPTHAVLALASVRPSYNIDHNPQWFLNRLNELCDLLERDNIIPIIHIGFPMSDKKPVLQHFKNYRRMLLKVAAERSYLVSRSDYLWEDFRSAGKVSSLSQARGIRQTFTGHQVFARSLLDTFGFKGEEVPSRLRINALPGIIPEWKWIEYETPQKLNAAMIANIETSGWRKLKLPMPADKGHTAKFINSHMMYETQAKQLGFGLEMSGIYSNTIRAVGQFHSNGGEKFLNIGGGVKEIWLNGEKIKDGLTNMFIDGRHPGARRYKVQLIPGENTIVLDCTMNFFVSLTEDDQWGLQKPPK